MHFVVWTSSLSHVRKDGEKNENMTLCLSLALVTKKERFSMSKTKPNQKKKKGMKLGWLLKERIHISHNIFLTICNKFGMLSYKNHSTP